MASVTFGPGLLAAVSDGLSGRSFKILLLSAEQGPYVGDEGDQFVSDLVAAETHATNYARRTVVPVVQWDALNSRVEVVVPDTTFPLLGGAVNEDIEWAVLFDDTGNDATSPVFVGWDLSATNNTTNGTDFLIDFSAEGNWHFTI